MLYVCDQPTHIEMGQDPWLYETPLGRGVIGVCAPQPTHSEMGQYPWMCDFLGEVVVWLVLTLAA